MTDENPNAFKHLYNEDFLKRMAEAITKTYPGFEQGKFLSILPKLNTLEMKPRVQLIRETLMQLLPKSYPTALQVLLKSAKTRILSGFDFWPYTDFIQHYGLKDAKLSLDALKELTPLFTSEFSVRPFLKTHSKLTLQYLEKCAKDPDVHVRRWASEGSRPRLPWGERLHDFVKDPSPTLKILDHLKFDPELYVRKSVSNHLNDITKDHPERVIKTLSQWKKSAQKEQIKNIDWIIHRSLRTLIKSGHPGALNLIGISTKTQLEVRKLKITPTLAQVGKQIEFKFTIRSLSTREQKLVVDYIIHFAKANGSTSAKVFKLKKQILEAGKELSFAKKHSLKKITTRVYYPGIHFLQIQVNGQAGPKVKWTLA